MPKETILVVDDERLVRWALQQKLEQWGYHVSLAEDGAAALSRIQLDNPDLITLDVKLPDMTGIDVLAELRERNIQIPVIVITAFGIVDDAVRSLKLGAYDFIEKPINFEKLENAIRNAMETKRLRTEVARTQEIQRSEFSVDRIVGVSAYVRDIRELIRKVAASEASTILVLGESGTGKDLVAHAIHYESLRRDRPFYAINCAAIPETLIESELFGHEKGAFTDARTQKKGMFEIADGGTLFMDEISEMTLSMQAKLLRVLEGQPFRRVGGVKNLSVDVRVIVASNRNLEEQVRASKFRQDLYFRLAIIPMHLRPLREHKEDIPALLSHFIQHYNKKFRKNIQGFTREADELLMNYDWPGNIRELKNAIERVMILAEGTRVGARHLPIRISEGGKMPIAAGEGIANGDIQLPAGGLVLYRVEKDLIRQALEQARGNKSTAARLLHITRDTLRYKVKKYKLD
ncbi:MAG: two component, sigma54 specific, transcriptional regulator, Fis family [Acidobacteria bacterium]|jgi:two-component system, NtrC family, response regulator AtoC|nr:two component, sigma54 specific, transcriptional regulator, Fis family [Acidobacteriota bacterium]